MHHQCGIHNKGMDGLRYPGSESIAPGEFVQWILHGSPELALRQAELSETPPTSQVDLALSGGWGQVEEASPRIHRRSLLESQNQEIYDLHGVATKYLNQI